MLGARPRAPHDADDLAPLRVPFMRTGLVLVSLTFALAIAWSSIKTYDVLALVWEALS